MTSYPLYLQELHAEVKDDILRTYSAALTLAWQSGAKVSNYNREQLKATITDRYGSYELTTDNMLKVKPVKS